MALPPDPQTPVIGSRSALAMSAPFRLQNPRSAPGRDVRLFLVRLQWSADAGTARYS